MRIPLSTLTFCHPPLREQSCSAEEASYDDSEEKLKERHLLRALDAGWLVKGVPPTQTKRTSTTSSEKWP